VHRGARLNGLPPRLRFRRDVAVRRPGGPVHYVDFGGSGPPLVLVHGLAGSALNWMTVGDELTARHHALAPDLRGFGRTPLGPGTRLRDNQLLLDRFLREVAGTPATVVANSMGALLAVRQAADHPETVANLVLVDPALPWRGRRPFDPTLWTVSAALVTPMLGGPVAGRRARRWGAERVVAAAFELCCSDPARISPDVVRAHVALEAERIAESRSQRALVQAARSLAWALGRSEIETYRRVQAPTLVVHGDRDRLVPTSFSRAIGDRFAWEVVVLPGIGHLPMLEAPAEFLAVTSPWLQVREGSTAAEG